MGEWAQQTRLVPIGLELETVLVNIDVPRTTDYLAMNPSGLVLALAYDGHVLTESGFIAHSLADSHPSHLLKYSSDSDGALQRFAIGFFVDTFFTKVQSLFDTGVMSSGEGETTATDKYIDAIVNHIGPLLADAAPFSGGSCRLTLAEVQTGSFLLRVLALPTHERILPISFLKALEDMAPNFWRRSHAVIAEKTVTAVWDEDAVVKQPLRGLRKIKQSKQ